MNGRWPVKCKSLVNDNEGQKKTSGAFKDRGGRRSYNCITIEDKQPLQENKRAQDMNGVGLKTQILFFFSTGIIEPQSMWTYPKNLYHFPK